MIRIDFLMYIIFLFFLGVILNSFSCVASFSNMNFNAMFDNIVLGQVQDKNEAYHESSMIKQTLYYMITMTAYLG